MPELFQFFENSTPPHMYKHSSCLAIEMNENCEDAGFSYYRKSLWL